MSGVHSDSCMKWRQHAISYQKLHFQNSIIDCPLELKGLSMCVIFARSVNFIESGTLCSFPNNNLLFEYNILHSIKIHRLSYAIHVKLSGKLPLADVCVSTDTPTSVSFSCQQLLCQLAFILNQLCHSQRAHLEFRKLTVCTASLTLGVEPDPHRW